MKKFLFLPALALAFMLGGVLTAKAAVIYDSIPVLLPLSSPSLGFQATQTSEFGDYVTFGGTDRILTSVDVVMNSWACQTGNWFDSTCATPEPTNLGYTHPITLTIYNVDTSGSTPVIGSEITSVTQNIFVPWRPAKDPACSGTGHSSPLCYNGFNFVASFNIPNVVVPNSVVYGISFNTQSWGAEPTEVDGPYNSLNMSVPSVVPSIGTDINSDAVFWNTMTLANYTDPTGSVGTFRQDTGWSGQVPAARFNASAPIVRTAEITSPDAGETVSGMVDFTASLTDDDADSIQWAVRQGTCATGTNTVFGNVDGHADVASINQSDLTNQKFSFTGDMSTMASGMYCFIYNPAEDSGESNIRKTVEFNLLKATPTNKDECKKSGWETFSSPEFKNQGQCVSYLQANENAGKQ